MNHILRYLNVKKKIMGMGLERLKFSLPVLALLVALSSPALTPHSVRVSHLTDSHRQRPVGYKELSLFSFHTVFDYPGPQGFKSFFSKTPLICPSTH